MNFSSPTPSVSEEIRNMFDNDDFLPKKSSSQCASDIPFIETKYENIEYIDDDFIVEHNEEVASEMVREEYISKFEEFGEFTVGQDEGVFFEEVLIEDDIGEFKEVKIESCVERMSCEKPTNYEETGELEKVIAPCLENLVCFSTENGSLLTKKRKRNPELWKSNIRKRKRESGQQYISINNKKVPAKSLKPPCNDCCFNCVNIFSAKERLNIFKLFWSLTDNEKKSFYLKFVKRDRVKRRRKYSKEIIKQFSFKYYFEKNQSILRVCRVFFINTLSIDQKRIYYCFQNLKNKSCSPIEDDIVKFEEVDEFTLGQESMAYEKIRGCKESVEDSIAKLEEVIIPCTENTICFPSETGSLLAKRRKKNPELWKPNSRKRLKKSEQPAISINNNVVPAKALKPPCSGCCFNCVNIFSVKERLKIFKSFWSLTDKERKSFYLKFVIRDEVKRRRKYSRKNIKQFTFKYYFEKKQSIHRVCRVFFINTLSIDQKRIYYCFQNLKNELGSSKEDNVKDNVVKIEEVGEFAVDQDKLLACKEVRVREKVRISQESVEDSISQLEEIIIPCPENPVCYPSESESLLTKKRIKNPELGKSNKRKRQRKSAQQYPSIKNKEVAAKTLKPPCSGCCFNCVNIFTTKERLNIFKSFWSLTDKEKKSFYFKFVIRDQVKRRTKYSRENIKQFTFNYYFEKNQSLHRVCRVFFLNTLSIDQKRIYYCFQNIKNKLSPPIQDNIGNFEEVGEFAIGQDEVEDCKEAMVCKDVLACEETLEDIIVKFEEVIVPDYSVSVSAESESLATRKRKNVGKRQRKSGEKHISINKKEVPAKSLKPPCNDCCFNCVSIFTAQERLNIFKSFWSLTEKEKKTFYFKFVIRDLVKRRRKYSEENIKQFTFKYYFEKDQSIHRVCRVFFLNTLSIDQKRIYYYFQNLKSKSGPPIEDTVVKIEEVDEFAVDHDEMVSYEDAMVCEEEMACKETEDVVDKIEIVPCPEYLDYFSSENGSLLTKKAKEKS